MAYWFNDSFNCTVCGLMATAYLCVSWPHEKQDESCRRIQCLPVEQLTAREDHIHQREPRGPLNLGKLGTIAPSSGQNLTPGWSWGSTNSPTG